MWSLPVEFLDRKSKPFKNVLRQNRVALFVSNPYLNFSSVVNLLIAVNPRRVCLK